MGAAEAEELRDTMRRIHDAIRFGSAEDWL
jgi:hypothetical protein